MIDTTLCFECGTDTRYYGFVNRIWCGRDNLDCYKCGPCSDTHDAIADANGIENFDDNKWDAYMADRIKDVDQRFPDAPKFREFMETEPEWREEIEIPQVQKLIDSYRNIWGLTFPKTGKAAYREKKLKEYEKALELGG